MPIGLVILAIHIITNLSFTHVVSGYTWKSTADCWDSGEPCSFGSQRRLHLPAEEMEAAVCCPQAVFCLLVVRSSTRCVILLLEHWPLLFSGNGLEWRTSLYMDPRAHLGVLL